MIEMFFILGALIFLLFVFIKFFFVFKIIVNLAILTIALLKVRVDLMEKKYYTYLLCIFIGLFPSLLWTVPFLWKITSFVLITAVSAQIVIYISDYF